VRKVAVVGGKKGNPAKIEEQLNEHFHIGTSATDLLVVLL